MLVLVAGVVTIVFMAMLARFALVDAQRKLAKQTGVETTLDRIETALVEFVAQHKRLPCPADGTLPGGAANAGLESPFPPAGSCSPANQRAGVVPWATLGIAEADAADPWNGRISYRVDPALAGLVPLLMDMSKCDASGTGSTAAGGDCRTPVPACLANPTTCTSPMNFLAGKGLDVWSGSSGAAGWAARPNNRAGGTGAAYVLIAHGPTGAGAYNKGGVYQPGTIGPIQPGNLPAGLDEMPNLNNQPVALPSAQATAYRDARADDTLTPAHFDDYLRHPTIRAVLEKASLGPRIH